MAEHEITAKLSAKSQLACFQLRIIVGMPISLNLYDILLSKVELIQRYVLYRIYKPSETKLVKCFQIRVIIENQAGYSYSK